MDYSIIANPFTQIAFTGPYSNQAVPRGGPRAPRRTGREARTLLPAGRNVSEVAHGERRQSGSCRTSIFRRTSSSGRFVGSSGAGDGIAEPDPSAVFSHRPPGDRRSEERRGG